MNPSMPLFRKEMLQHRAERLHGDVHLAVPVSWQVISYLLLATLVAAVAFLAMASYSRVETVGGAIVLDKGVAPIMPSRAGIIQALFAREGQQVRAGAPLVRIRAEEDMAAGGSALNRVIDAMSAQDQRLARQSDLIMSAASAEQARLSAAITGLVDEVTRLDEQIAAQRRLVEAAEDEYREIRGVAGRGFISRRDLEAREASLLSRRQQLAQLQQLRAAKSAEVTAAHRAIPQAMAAAEAQAVGILSNRAALAQQRAQAEGAQGYTLRSPIDGTITAVTARAGQPVSTNQPLMVVMPSRARPRVELYVPTGAAGFLAEGQEVRLAVDAFPFQRFGTIEARIVEISRSAVPRTAPDGGAIPVYLVTAELRRPWVVAFGRAQPLLPGMTLTARIIAEDRSLLEWLFEPLFAVGNR